MLSHASLSKEPMCVDMGHFEYSQLEQRSLGKGTNPLSWATTANGTQTFGGGGAPMDSDNDND
jgi:hypothetical protein